MKDQFIQKTTISINNSYFDTQYTLCIGATLLFAGGNVLYFGGCSLQSGGIEVEFDCVQFSRVLRLVVPCVYARCIVRAHTMAARLCVARSPLSTDILPNVTTLYLRRRLWLLPLMRRVSYLSQVRYDAGVESRKNKNTNFNYFSLLRLNCRIANSNSMIVDKKIISKIYTIVEDK